MPYPSEFWLSGYNAIATTPGETMTFASDRPVNFEMIEIEVLRQPGGGKIDVKLDGVVETSYDLASPKTEPVVIRLLPTRGATEKVKEISITTTGRGPVSRRERRDLQQAERHHLQQHRLSGRAGELRQQVQQQAAGQRPAADQSADRHPVVRHQ